MQRPRRQAAGKSELPPEEIEKAMNNYAKYFGAVNKLDDEDLDKTYEPSDSGSSTDLESSDGSEGEESHEDDSRKKDSRKGEPDEEEPQKKKMKAGDFEKPDGPEKLVDSKKPEAELSAEPTVKLDAE